MPELPVSESVEQHVAKLIEEHPQMFRELVGFLTARQWWGYFQINRGGEKITGWNVMRSERDEGSAAARNT